MDKMNNDLMKVRNELEQEIKKLRKCVSHSKSSCVDIPELLLNINLSSNQLARTATRLLQYQNVPRNVCWWEKILRRLRALLIGKRHTR